MIYGLMASAKLAGAHSTGRNPATVQSLRSPGLRYTAAQS